MWEVWDGDEYIEMVYTQEDADRYAEAGCIVIPVRNA